MLEQMRNSSGSLVIWVLFAIIIAAFVLFFGSPSDSLGCGSNNEYSIQVENEEVSVHSWRFAYNGMPMLFGNVPGTQRRPMALEFLLQREILAQAAEKMDFQVSDKVIDDAIANGELYLLGNKMDGTKIYFENSDDKGFFFEYQYLENLVKGRLGLPNMRTFKDEQRREILAYLMKQELLQSALVSEEEVRDVFIRANTTVSANYVKFDVARYRNGLKMSEAEVSSYAAANEEELKKQWEQVKPRWESEKSRVRARILKVTKKPSLPVAGADKDAPLPEDIARKIVEDAHKRIAGGESFAVVAKELSEDRSATLGGLIGWRAAESMGQGQEVVDATKELEIGKVSGIIDSKMHYYLVLVEERSDKGLSFEQKKFDLAIKAAPNAIAKQKAKAAADKALAMAAEQPLSEMFKPAAAPLPGAGGIPQSIKDQLTPEQLEQLLNSQIPGSKSGALVSGPIVLAQAGAQPPAQEKPIADAPAKAATAIKKQPITKPTKLKSATLSAEDSEVPPPTLQNFSGTTRNGDFIAGVGRSQSLVTDLFGTLATNQVAPTVYEVSEGDGYVIIELTDRSEADMKEFEEQSDDLQQSLAQSKGMERFLSWMLGQCNKLKDAGTIKPNYGLLVSGSDNQQIPYEPCYSLAPTK